LDKNEARHDRTSAAQAELIVASSWRCLIRGWPCDLQWTSTMFCQIPIVRYDTVGNSASFFITLKTILLKRGWVGRVKAILKGCYIKLP